MPSKRVYDRIHRVLACVVGLLTVAAPAAADGRSTRVVDVPTRPGVTERVLLIVPPKPKVAAILFSGGHGNVGIATDGSIANAGNFLIRTRTQFARNGIAVAVLDVPSDRRMPPYLGGFRQTPEHLADVRAVIAWLRRETHLPVWLIATSRGTQSAAFVATQTPTAAAGGPDGLVLTSTIFVGSNTRDRAVPQMPLGRIAVPVLVVHHERDACPLCPYAAVAPMMAQITASPRKHAVGVHGGTGVGDPCEALAYHGFNGIEPTVVRIISTWMEATSPSFDAGGGRPRERGGPTSRAR